MFWLTHYKNNQIIYRDCWCGGNGRSQGISSREIYLVFPRYSGSDTRMVRCWLDFIPRKTSHDRFRKWYEAELSKRPKFTVVY